MFCRGMMRPGTVFDRPEFNRLMNDIRTGKIKCLVVRDLSRFGKGVDHVLQRDDEAFAGAVRIKVVVVLFDGDKPKSLPESDRYLCGQRTNRNGF